jgi:hypothetical protein
LIKRIQSRGLEYDAIRRQIAARLAERTAIAEGPFYRTQSGQILPEIQSQRLAVPGRTAELRRLLEAAAAASAIRVAIRPAPGRRGAEAAPEALHRVTSAEFRHDVISAAEKAPQWAEDSGKVFIHRAWEELVKDPKYKTLSLEDFKRLLMEDPLMRAKMSRADLVQAMDPEDVARGNIEYKSAGRTIAEWNFIKLPRGR